MDKETLLKLALFAAGIWILCSFRSCDYETIEPVYSDEEDYDNNIIYEDKKFEVGEHIISIPIQENINQNLQHKYYPGYKCVGIATSSYGQSFENYSGACLLYVNEYPVICEVTGINTQGEYVYHKFGTPVDFYKEINNPSNAEEKDFNIGEHIISVPILSENIGVVKQFEYHEGYEAIGIATSTYGKSFENYGGGAILYVNIEPVRCNAIAYDIDNNPIYSEFGSPIEKGKTLLIK